MPSTSFIPVYGTIVQVSAIPNQCSDHIVSVRTENGVVNLMVSSSTYVIDQIQLHSGMRIVGFYDAGAPAPMIFPPQYNAVAIGRRNANELAIMDYFDNSITTYDNTLQLNIAPHTILQSLNGQSYNCNVGNNLLIAFYGATTRSIPPQTSPRRVIVWR